MKEQLNHVYLVIWENIHLQEETVVFVQTQMHNSRLDNNRCVCFGGYKEVNGECVQCNVGEYSEEGLVSL